MRSLDLPASNHTAENSISKPNTKKPNNDAISLLKADHRKVEGPFEQFEKARDRANKNQLAGQICAALTKDVAAEEEVFYPEVRAALPDDHALLDEAEVEHGSLKVLIADIEEGDNRGCSMRASRCLPNTSSTTSGKKRTVAGYVGGSASETTIASDVFSRQP